MRAFSVEPEPLSPLAEMAAHCWAWCGGWFPERWPVYAAIYDVIDWHALSELMRAVRAANEKTAEKAPDV